MASTRLANFFVLIVASLTLSACGAMGGSAMAGPTPPPGQIVADGAWVRKAASGQNSAIYLTLRNGGAEDTLVQAATEVAMSTEIHETVQASGGMMEMRPLTAGLKVPANGQVMLAPGGYHIMLMGVKQDIPAGGNVKLKLTFKSGKSLDLTVPAQDGPAMKMP